MSSDFRRLVASRWFALADLACAAVSGFWWYSQPGIGGWPLFIALAPWALRLAVGRPPIKLTRLDALVIVFLLTALVGVWAAYDRAAAWDKWWVLVGAVVVYYALAAQPAENLWLVAGLLGLLGAAIAVYSLLTYDWQAFPRHFAALDRVGIWWMSVRPAFPGFIQPNVAGGLLAMLLPFPIAGSIRGWRGRQWGPALIGTGMGGLALLGLLLTSSRGSWGALVIALSMWAIWEMGGVVAGRLGWPKRVVSGVALLAMAGVVLATILSYPGGLQALASKVPDGESRYVLAFNTVRLVADFPFTGGGLNAFTGLYSRYMLVIFVPYFTYSHDFYLDVALEQGLFGLVALLGMLAGSLCLLARPQMAGAGHSLMRWALVTGLLVVGLHGILDDALYGNQGTPLLLALAGLSVALTRIGSEGAGQRAMGIRQRGDGNPTRRWPHWQTGAIVGVIGAGALLVLIGPRLAGAWYADLGAVEMARVELVGWGSLPWDAPIPVSAFAPAKSLFEQALRFDPANRTARQRLGLIAERGDDYPLAVTQLGTAYQADPGHRGVVKSLGDDYVWLGQIDRAVPLLTSIPEAAEQMDAYAWWWKEHGRPDRSAYAAQMAAVLRTGAIVGQY
jgi:O-Antigen ligase